MRIRIYFNEEEEREAERAIHGIDYYCALFEFSNFLRREEKEIEANIKRTEVERIRKAFYEILNEYNISLED